MTHTLVTFLGKGQRGTQPGYSKATYAFPDGVRHTTSFFGLALAEYLQPDRIVILGTCGSMWGVLVEDGFTGGSNIEENARYDLWEAERAENVDQSLLDRFTPIMQQAPVIQRAGRPEVVPRIVPFGRDGKEQHDILATVSSHVPHGRVSFDLTHGFRHMGVVGMLSAFVLERIGHHEVESLWYGARDMTPKGQDTPVLKLDGLHAIQRWVSALDRFDASGDYGVFAPLLKADGVPEDKVRCLEDAAFYERILNLSDAARKLRTFLPVTKGQLPGVSELFREKLEERLNWIHGRDLAAQQTALAREYLRRGDFVRAAIFAREAIASDECPGYDWSSPDVRREAERNLAEKFRARGAEQFNAYDTIRQLRNALAHSNPPEDDRFRKLLKSPHDLRNALQNAIDCLLPEARTS